MYKPFLGVMALLLSGTVSAQFFRTATQQCTGADVKLDTIFYSADKAMPFDRCFNLSVRMPGTPKVDFFYVIPVDKFGKKKVRKRDYRVYMKALYKDRNARRQAKRETSFEEFSSPDMPISIFFKDIFIRPGPVSTEFILRMPQLEPNRLYKLYLVTREEGQAQSMKVIENFVLNTALDTLRMAGYTKAKGDYEKVLKGRPKGELPLRTYNFDDFSHTLFDCREKIPASHITGVHTSSQVQKARYDKKSRQGVRSFSKEYRFYLVPSGRPFNMDSTQTLAATRYIKISTEEELQQVAPLLLLGKMKAESITDVRGTPLDFSNTGNYDIYSMVSDTMRIKKPATTVSGVFSFGQIGSVSWVPQRTADQLAISPFQPPSPNCDTTIIADYRELQRAIYDIDSISALALSRLDRPSMQLVMDYAAACPCEKEGIKDITQKDDLTRTISFFVGPDAAELNKLKKGLISLKDPYTPVAGTNWAARVSNLKSSVAQISSLQEFILKLRSDNPTLSTQIKCLDTLKGQLNDIVKLHQQISENIDKRVNSLIAQFSLRNITPVTSGSTSVLEFVSANKFRITPDFGLVGVFKGSGVDFQDLTPYLGFHINFRSIDKSIEMKHVAYKSWRHYFSFTAGITLKSLKIEGKRDDFFGNNCLLTGIGFRLNNFFRVTGGVVWFKTIDKNPLSTNKPIGFSPFTGLSLDLELQTLFGGLQNLFK